MLLPVKIWENRQAVGGLHWTPLGELAAPPVPVPLAGGKGARCTLPKNPVPFGTKATAVGALLTPSSYPHFYLASDTTAAEIPRSFFFVPYVTCAIYCHIVGYFWAL